jgi:hypothetical protein
MSIKYIESIDEVIEIHNKTVEISGGGCTGVIDTLLSNPRLNLLKMIYTTRLLRIN